MASLELKIPPLMLLAASGLVMFGLSLIAPALAFPLPRKTAIAGTLAVVGACTAVAGVIAFRTSGTTVNPTTPDKSSIVVSGGVYRFTRNPMYLGFALILSGWAAYLSNTASVLVLPAFVAYMNKFQIAPEERVLLTKFGVPFSDCMTSVRRWM